MLVGFRPDQDLQLARHDVWRQFRLVPMIFCLGFSFPVLIAGLTGVMLAVVPLNWQLTDSYSSSRTFITF